MLVYMFNPELWKKAVVTSQQHAHLEELQREFCIQLRKKYEAGAEEHGGFVGDLDPDTLFHHAKEEILDLWVYLHSLKQAAIKMQDENEKSWVEERRALHLRISHLEQENAQLRTGSGVGWQSTGPAGVCGHSSGVEQFAEAPRVSENVSSPLPRSSFVIRLDAKMARNTIRFESPGNPPVDLVLDREVKS